MTGPEFVIRACKGSDCPALVNLVRALAVYERLEAYVQATPDDFRATCSVPIPPPTRSWPRREEPRWASPSFFPPYSTFRGRPGLYLEDLFVEPAHRGRGIGKALLASVARRALERGCGRVEWSVLDWNTPAIAFYESTGARALKEWTVYQVDDESLARLASLAPEAQGT